MRGRRTFEVLVVIAGVALVASGCRTQPRPQADAGVTVFDEALVVDNGRFREGEGRCQRTFVKKGDAGVEHLVVEAWADNESVRTPPLRCEHELAYRWTVGKPRRHLDAEDFRRGRSPEESESATAYAAREGFVVDAPPSERSGYLIAIHRFAAPETRDIRAVAASDGTIAHVVAPHATDFDRRLHIENVRSGARRTIGLPNDALFNRMHLQISNDGRVVAVTGERGGEAVETPNGLLHLGSKGAAYAFATVDGAPWPLPPTGGYGDELLLDDRGPRLLLTSPASFYGSYSFRALVQDKWSAPRTVPSNDEMVIPDIVLSGDGTTLFLLGTRRDWRVFVTAVDVATGKVLNRAELLTREIYSLTAVVGSREALVSGNGSVSTLVFGASGVPTPTEACGRTVANARWVVGGQRSGGVAVWTRQGQLARHFLRSDGTGPLVLTANGTLLALHATFAEELQLPPHPAP